MRKLTLIRKYLQKGAQVLPTAIIGMVYWPKRGICIFVEKNHIDDIRQAFQQPMALKRMSSLSLQLYAN